MDVAADASLPAPALPPFTPSLVADRNEPRDLVALIEARGVEVEHRRLAPADFVVGRLAVERKSVGDFLASLVDKRLFEQMARLREAYPAPVALLLEGDLSFFEARRQPASMWGALSSIAVDMGVAVLPTPSKTSSAELLAVLARRAARQAEREAAAEGAEARASRHDVRHKPKSNSFEAAQRFAVQGLPGIGDVVSHHLLESFGSLRRVFAASERELLRVRGMGKGRAREVTEFLDRPYRGRQARLPGGDGAS